MISLGYAAGDTGQRVRVSAQSNGFPDGILIILRLQEADQGLWHRALAGLVPLIVAIPVGIGLMKVVTESLLDVVPDIFL